MGINIIIVSVTCANKQQAQLIASVLVQEKLAACVQQFPITSCYQWKDELVCEDEIQLTIKTSRHLFSKIQAKIKSLHSYEIPEIIATEVVEVSQEYQKWIDQSVEN